MKLATTLALFATSAYAGPLFSSKIFSENPPLLVNHQNAPTQYVDVNGDQIAYRRFGNPSALPLFYMTHFLGSMDTNDPLLINSLAQNREVILFDNAGVGHSGGTIPNNVSSMAATAVDFLAAINVPKADIMGFSLGGFVAQTMAVTNPDLLNRLILSGTQSGDGPGAKRSNLSELAGSVPADGPNEDTFKLQFFFPSNTSQAAAHEWFQRTQERQVEGEERKNFVLSPGNVAQAQAIINFVADPVPFDNLSKLQGRVLITNGQDDRITPTVNSFVIQQKLLNSSLVIYPDSGHGHLYQFAEDVATQVQNFLS